MWSCVPLYIDLDYRTVKHGMLWSLWRNAIVNCPQTPLNWLQCSCPQAVTKWVCKHIHIQLGHIFRWHSERTLATVSNDVFNTTSGELSAKSRYDCPPHIKWSYAATPRPCHEASVTTLWFHGLTSNKPFCWSCLNWEHTLHAMTHCSQRPTNIKTNLHSFYIKLIVVTSPHHK